VHDPLAVVPFNSAFADYGFANCKDEADKEALVKVYKLYFASKGADPGELHKAYIRGQRSLYLRRFVSLVNAPSKRDVYSRLLRNFYPLAFWFVSYLNLARGHVILTGLWQIRGSGLQILFNRYFAVYALIVVTVYLPPNKSKEE